MLNLRKLVPRGYDFAQHFLASATCSHTAAELLESMLKNPKNAKESFGQLKEIEKKADSQAAIVHKKLPQTFITSIDREDISALARRLDTVVDFIESVGLNVLLDAEISGSLDHFERFLPRTLSQASVVSLATTELVSAVSTLRKLDGMGATGDMTEIHGRVHDLEHCGDELWVEIKRERVRFLVEQENAPLTRGETRLLLWVENVCHRLEDCLDMIKMTVDAISDIHAKVA